jgi:uncharacterized iron-regulated membrane protein
VVRPKRAGLALAIVLVLIAVFGVLCQVLTMLVAIQHRQAFHQAEQAQAHRLADAALLRAGLALQRDPQWNGETWMPTLPQGSAAVRLSVRKEAGNSHVRAEATFTTPAGRIHKSNQTLDASRTSAKEVSESNAP